MNIDYSKILNLVLSVLVSVFGFIFFQMWKDIEEIQNKLNSVENVTIENKINVEQLHLKIIELFKDQEDIENEAKKHKHCE